MRRSAVALVVAALALAGCSGDDDVRDPAERLAAAPAATAGVGTARTAMTLDTELDAEGERGDLTLSGEGAVDFPAERASMELRVPGLANPLRTVVDGDVTYTRLPEVLGDADVAWVRQDGYGTDAGMGFAAGAGVGSENPRRLLEALAVPEEGVGELGEATVRGSDVEGYELTVRGATLADGLDAVPEAFADLEIPMEAWLDADDRVRRLVASFELAALTDAAVGDGEDSALPAASGLDGTLVVTVELFDFGADVDIAVPEPTAVIDAATFRREILEEGG